jgi:hypothetical protein
MEDNLSLFQKLVILMNHMQENLPFFMVLKGNATLSTPLLLLRVGFKGGFHLVTADLEELDHLRSDLRVDSNSEGGSWETHKKLFH